MSDGKTFTITLDGNVSDFIAKFQQAGGSVEQLTQRLGAIQLQKFLESMNNGLKPLNAGFSSVNNTVEKSTKLLFKNRMAYMELGHVARSTADLLLLGGNNPRMLLAQIPQAIQGLTMAGIKMSTLIPIIGGIGLALGGGYLAWMEFTKGTRDAQKAAEDFAKAIKGIPGALEAIRTSQKAGLLSPEAANQYRDILSGKVGLFKNHAGDIIRGQEGKPAPTETITVPAPAAPGSQQFAGAGPLFEQQITKIVAMQKLSLAESKDWVLQQVLAGKAIEDVQKAMADQSELSKQIHAESEGQLAKETFAIHKKYQAQRDEIEKNMAIERAAGTLTPKKEALALDDIAISKHNELIESAKKELEIQKKGNVILSTRQKHIDAIVARLELNRKRELANISKTEQEHIRFSREAARISEQQYDLDRERIESNFALTARQKANRLLPVNAAQIYETQNQIAENTVQKSNLTNSPEHQNELTAIGIRLQQRLNGLIADQNQLRIQAGGLLVNLQASAIALYDQYDKLETDFSDFALSPIRGFHDGLARALDDLIVKGTTAKQFFATLGVSIAESMAQSFSNMVADWVTSHLIMKGVSLAWAAFRSALGWGEVADHAAQTATKVGVHAAGEEAQTASTGSGAFQRGAIRLAETIFHGIQTAIKVAVHIAGELAMTAMTLVQSTIRIAAAIAEAVPNLLKAAFKAASSVADIPYVGPILALAAMGAIIGAGVKYMAGFERGGYTGDGARTEAAGVVHRGEFVMTAERTAQYRPILEAIHAGTMPQLLAPNIIAAPRIMSGGGPANSPARQTPQVNNFEIHNWPNHEAMTKHIRENPDVHHIIVEQMAKNTHVILPRR